MAVLTLNDLGVSLYPPPRIGTNEQLSNALGQGQQPCSMLKTGSDLLACHAIPSGLAWSSLRLQSMCLDL